VHSPHTRGWQSPRFCDYPQEIGLELLSGAAQISQIQLLSHQSKIASKVEIFIGTGSDYLTASFKRLGYMSLDSNERSSFQARELKTVYLDISGNFVRLLVHQCHTNKFNLFNQVGIIAVNLIGGEEGGGDARRQGGSGAQSRYPGPPVPPANNAFNDLSIDLNLDAQTAAKLKTLSDAKNRAIESEDYALAKQIKVVEGELRTLGARLAQLEVAKRQAVKTEDFDKAMNFKSEMDALRGEIEQMVRETNIPGVTDNRVPPSYKSHASPRVDEGSTQPMRAARAPVPIAETAFDEMPVGGGNAGGRFDDYDADEPDRPIKPKAAYAITADEEDDQTAYKPVADEQAESFPPGCHPLEGVSGALELPGPEVMSGKSKETSDALGITALIGEYRSRCLFSKTWALREAAVSKTRLMINNEFATTPGLNDCVKGVAGIVRIGADDKFAGVFFESVNLLDDLLGIVRNVKIPRSTFAPLADPIVVNLIEKLSDGGERIRKVRSCFE
jgi:centrosomal protein CEP104